jgi:endonuclease YncB( thermonuclease family)
MNLIVVTERQANASILMRRCNWLIALAFSAFIVSFVACAPSHDAPESASPASSATATSDATPSSQQFPSEAKVVRVIDGVTIEVEHEGERFLVRYLGVSIPASADLAEASEFNQFIAQGKTVVLSSEDAGVDFDGAHLRYVFIDGEMVNLKLLSGGWGEVAQFPASFEKFEEFFKAESLARTDSRGIWSVETSSPVPSSSEATPQISRPTPSPTQNFVGGTLPARPGSPSGSGGGCEFSGSDTPVIKGNVDQRSGELLYHVPESLFYSTTVVEPGQGDRWFCTEAEAQALGWERSKR